MPRKKTPNPMCRMCLSVPTEVRERIESLQKNTCSASMTEVICRAVALYEALMNAKDKGHSIVLDDGKKQKDLWIV